MFAKTKRVFIRVLVGLATFSISVALTLLWMVPKATQVTNPQADITSKIEAPQLRDGWKLLKLRDGVSLAVPQDIEAIEPFGDAIRYREAYRNKEFSLTIAQDLLTPKLGNGLDTQLLFSCEADHPAPNNPDYEESTIEIDKRNAQMRIDRSSRRGPIFATLCFPRENLRAPLLVAATCKDEKALETAQLVFRSITFKN